MHVEDALANLSMHGEDIRERLLLLLLLFLLVLFIFIGEYYTSPAIQG